MMPCREAANRIDDHMRIHFLKEYPRAQKITEALSIAVDLLRGIGALQEDDNDPDQKIISCSGCNHLLYNSGGGAECAIGLGRICPDTGFVFHDYRVTARRNDAQNHN